MNKPRMTMNNCMVITWAPRCTRHFQILYLHKEHYERYARLEINEAQEHYDPSDHLIISHALCNGIPLISDDDKFPFYRGQGLELIEN